MSYKNYDDNLISNNNDYDEVAEDIAFFVENQKNKYKEITQKAYELYETNQITELIDLYNNELNSIYDRAEALSLLVLKIFDSDNRGETNLIELRKSILKENNREFVYFFDNAMFQSGIISPEEFTQSIEEGLKRQIPVAYAIKSLFYYYGLESFETSKQSIEKAITLEPNNLEFKKMLKELEDNIK